MPSRRWLWISLGLAIFLGLVSTKLATFYTDILWFREVGYLSVFMRMLQARWVLALVGGFVFFLVALVNLAAIFWGREELTVIGGVVMPIQLPPTVRRWFYLVAVIPGFFGGLALFGQWHVVLAYLNATPFGIADPFFGQDVSFYVFKLPFIQMVQQSLWAAGLLSLILSGLIYYVLGDLRVSGRRLVASRRALVHLSVVAAGLFVLKAYGYQISTWNLMYSPRGVAFGASYTDIHAQVPAYRILMGYSIVAAGISLLSIALRSLRWTGYAAAVLVVLSIAVGWAYPAFMQQFTVSPNEIAYEIPFIEKNIAYTRQAFNLDQIEEVEYPALDTLSWETLDRNASTVENLRLWDYRVLGQTYRQIQEIRMYYRFHDVDVDRYTVNGQYRQVFLSPREIDISLLPPDALTWVNLHLKYTHGYGLVMSPASGVEAGGMPSLYVKDVPPKTPPDLPINRPEVYFGELTNHYVILKTKEPEFDYPRMGEEAVAATFYEGNAGIKLDNFLKRLAFTLRFRDYQIMVSGALTPDSVMVFRRNVIERVQAIAPFFMYDRDPYMVLAGGKLYWVIDAYTVSANYPYSQPDAETGVNYVRNSVKAVVDAYDGKVTFYRFDETDPIISTYQKIFPGLLKPREEMPAELLAHIRYPQDLFEIQSRMLVTYHMTDPRVYYNKEDYWEIPQEMYGGRKTQPVEPYYVVIKLPAAETGEYILMRPFTPRGKPNMTAWLCARCDPEHYGKMLLFRSPKDKLVPGPMQVESIFAQDPAISQAMTLWGQVGSQVIRGNLLAIPIDMSILYVEPLYIQAENVQIPELKRVLVYHAGRVVMGVSVRDAFEQLLGTGQAPPVTPGVPTEPGNIASLVERANALYREAQEKLRQGDWAGYGRAIEELGRVLEDMRRLGGPATGGT
ncbi:MAG TPA: UPF0182 family protein [Firmicutes bacterium]|nr:UPF0182 family protein [Candidatus Fermentithermobacillaceae bacterium]